MHEEPDRWAGPSGASAKPIVALEQRPQGTCMYERRCRRATGRAQSRKFAKRLDAAASARRLSAHARLTPRRCPHSQSSTGFRTNCLARQEELGSRLALSLPLHLFRQFEPDFSSIPRLSDSHSPAQEDGLTRCPARRWHSRSGLQAIRRQVSS